MSLVSILLDGDFRVASSAASDEFAPLCFEFRQDDSLVLTIAIWEAVSPNSCRIILSHRTITSGQRLPHFLRLVAAYHASPEFQSGQVFVNLGDAGHKPGLAFCGDTPSFTLIPDAPFIAHDAYRNTALYFDSHPIAWEKRLRMAFWRGSLTGRMIGKDWRTIHRVKLCEITSREPPHLFDVGISGFGQFRDDEQIKAEVEAAGILRDFVPITQAHRWRYQIDIDGYSNAWHGLFQKLLTGSVVFKVESRYGFRQWYYDRLRPWENYVPVASEMADLVHKLRWIIGHDDAARRIGETGRALAMSMTTESELRAVISRVTCAFRDSDLQVSLSPSLKVE